MLKLQEITGIEGSFGMTISFELVEPVADLTINNEHNAYVEFALTADLGGQ